MAYTVMAYVVTAYVVMAYIVLACVAMAYTAMAYVVMARTVMAYVVSGSCCAAGASDRPEQGAERAALARQVQNFWCPTSDMSLGAPHRM